MSILSQFQGKGKRRIQLWDGDSYRNSLPLNSLYSTKELDLNSTTIPGRWKRWKCLSAVLAGRVVWTGGSIFLCSGEFGEVIEHFETLEAN